MSAVGFREEGSVTLYKLMSAVGFREEGSVTLYKLMSAVGFGEEGSVTLYRLMSAVVFWLLRNGISSMLRSHTSPLLLGPFS